MDENDGCRLEAVEEDDRKLNRLDDEEPSTSLIPEPVRNRILRLSHTDFCNYFFLDFRLLFSLALWLAKYVVEFE